jgi:hypothetical protein
VERWFEDADINTAITILERCSKPEERDNNIVKFVLLKKSLSELIPRAEKADDEAERWRRIDELVKLIENTNTYYEDDKIRIFPKKQKELWEEGYEDEEQEYTGSKWGKYLRAPQIFFRILEKGKDKLVPLRTVAKVRPGIKSGADDFFYLKEEDIKKLGIEEEYIKHYIIRSIRECKRIAVRRSDLKYRVLLVDKPKEVLRGTNVLKYIEYGERLGLSNPDTNPTCGKRTPWYKLDKREPPLLLFPDVIFERHISPINEADALADYDLHEIVPFDRSKTTLIGALLNCTLSALFAELNGRVNLGQGSLKLQSREIASISIVNPSIISSKVRSEIERVFNKMKEREIDSIFKEIGANSSAEVSLEKVRPDRRELDRIIMGEILGLSEEEQLEVYRAVVDLVKSRIERARSVESKKKESRKELEAMVTLYVQEFSKMYDELVKRFKSFPDAYLDKDVKARIVRVPTTSKTVACFNLAEGYYVDYGSGKMKCKSMNEAKYVALAVLAGKTNILVPEDESTLASILVKQEELVRELASKIDEFLELNVTDKKLREKIKPLLIRKLLGIDSLEYICQQSTSKRSRKKTS